MIFWQNFSFSVTRPNAAAKLRHLISLPLFCPLWQVKLLITLLCLKLQRRVSTHFKALAILYTTMVPSDHRIKAKIIKDHREVDQKVTYIHHTENVIAKVDLLITLICFGLQGRVNTHFKALYILYKTILLSNQGIITNDSLAIEANFCKIRQNKI